jgi:hypothetical protein
MTDKKALHVVEPTPEHGQRAALKPDANPALKGKGDVSLICGKCRAVLARDIWDRSLFDLGIICAECGTFNDTPSAIGGTVYGNVVYCPVGTYRLGSTVEMRQGVPMIGELFPGAGPPSATNLVRMGGKT